MLKFTKCHSLGNDFIIIDFSQKKNELIKFTKNKSWKNFVILSCDRHFGVGADGVLIIIPNNEVLIFNADGSQAEICLNGLRCASTYLYNKYHLQKQFNIKMGGKKIESQINKLNVINKINLSSKIEEKTIYIKNIKIKGHYLKIPNPHFIIQKKISHENLLKLGQLIENNSEFKNKTNVEFIWSTSNKNNYKMMVYERGVGPTLACGSGATAAFHLIAQRNKIKPNQKVNIKMNGGTLTFWLDEDKKINMQSEVNIIFSATLDSNFFNSCFKYT